MPKINTHKNAIRMNHSDTQDGHYYLKEITRIKEICYHNKMQIKTVISTRHFIDTHYDRELNLQILSRNQFTSRFHLLRLFKRYYGQTPQQYLTEKRLAQAKELLSNGANVTSACYDVGFESPSSFSTLFKSRFGSSPREFQKKATLTKSQAS